MAESAQISRKRMRFSSSEILTTSKLQSQRDLAGRFKPSGSLSGKIDSKVIRTYPRVTIKDLRLRRVFSPSTISSDCEFKSKLENRTKEHDDDEYTCDSQIHNLAKEGIKANVEESMLRSGSSSNVNEVEPTCEEINVSAVKKSSTNTCSNSVIRSCSRAKLFKNPASFSYKRLLPYLMQAADDGKSSAGQLTKPEKHIGQNPPAVNLSCEKETGQKPKVDVSELMTAKSQFPETIKPVSQSVDWVFNKQSAGSLCVSTSPLKKVTGSSPIKKPVCSRRKLFRTPGSVNYRRMLPYLRDLQEDKPCAPEVVNLPDHQKNNAPLTMLVSENGGAQEMASSNVAKESDTCCNENKEPLPCEHVLASPETSDPDKEQETQVKHVILDTENNLETPQQNVLCAEGPLSSPPLAGSRSSTEAASSASMFVESLAVEENMNGTEKTEAKSSSEEQPEEADSSNLTPELLDPSVELETPPSNYSPSKGILKRSIRGCRGICSCLNCSSFRLNAERAFEFSRNQLQDTEVMVLDLVGEISHLREMLENHNESYKTQAGEAAKRASEAAELAKSRLHQMNDDLQVHCRIPNEQRARVKFAHYVHEKTILKASDSEPNNLISRSP